MSLRQNEQPYSRTGNADNTVQNAKADPNTLVGAGFRKTTKCKFPLILLV